MERELKDWGAKSRGWNKYHILCHKCCGRSASAPLRQYVNVVHVTHSPIKKKSCHKQIYAMNIFLYEFYDKAKQSPKKYHHSEWLSGWVQFWVVLVKSLNALCMSRLFSQRMMKRSTVLAYPDSKTIGCLEITARKRTKISVRKNNRVKYVIQTNMLAKAFTMEVVA